MMAMEPTSRVMPEPLSRKAAARRATPRGRAEAVTESAIAGRGYAIAEAATATSRPMDAGVRTKHPSVLSRCRVPSLQQPPSDRTNDHVKLGGRGADYG